MTDWIRLIFGIIIVCFPFVASWIISDPENRVVFAMVLSFLLLVLLIGLFQVLKVLDSYINRDNSGEQP